MTRYATIDLNSGYVWWLGDADTPHDACVKSDAVSDVYGRSFEDKYGHDTGGGYAVYEVDDSFDVNDGQSRDEIAAAEAFPHIGNFRAVNA